MGERPLISLIVPAYNEGSHIADTLCSALTYLDASGLDYELIVVSDGSTDETPAIVERISRDHPRMRAICYQPNRGKGFAVRSGVLAARGRYVMFTDADLSIPITIVPQFLDALHDGYDVAIASRWHPDSAHLAPAPLPRRVMSRVFRRFVRMLVISDVRDTQCGGKAYRADVAHNLFSTQRIDHFSFDAEVIYLAVRSGYRIKEVPVTLTHKPESTVRPVRDSLRMLLDLVRIRLNATRGRYDR